jgi:hypothetical protein
MADFDFLEAARNKTMIMFNHKVLMSSRARGEYLQLIPE